jgi:hypothetical protein
MTVYKPMDPQIAWKAIEGYTDELTGEARKHEAFYRQFSCPRGCGRLQKEIDPKHTFSDPETLVGRSLLRCANCRYLVDPFSNLVLESGSAAKIPVETLPILDGDYLPKL